jgi:hypothetical protein
MPILTGAGSSPAGALPAGTNPTIFSPVPSQPTLPSALNYDAATRSFTTPIDPVDQQVQLLLTVEQGAVPALGVVGQRYRERFLGAPQSHIPALALDETKVALSALLKAGDILLRNVMVRSTTPGSNVVIVAYTNLRNPVLAQRNQTASVTV